MIKSSSKFVVTGGSGFIGTNLVQSLIDLGHQPLNLSIAPPLNSDHHPFYVNCNILDFDKYASIVSNFKPDFFIHLAAKTDLNGTSLNDYSANIQGVSNTVKVVNSVDSIKRVIYTSSRLVFEISHQPKFTYDYKPSTLYGQSKVIGEHIVLSQPFDSTPWMILRPTSIWGQWFGVPYRNFFDSVLSNRYRHPSSLVIKKSFGYVGNIIYQYLAYLGLPLQQFQHRTLFLSDFDPIDLLCFANSILSQSGQDISVKSVPVSVLFMAATLGSTASFMGYKNPPLTRFRLNNLLTNMVYDLSTEKSLVGELPFSNHDGIRNTLAWLNSPYSKF